MNTATVGAEFKPLDTESRLLQLAAALRHDPVKYVQAAYPWAEPFSPLAEHPGPDTWQTEILAYIRDNIGGRGLSAQGKPLRIAVAGGVGPGKSAVGAWVVDWGMTTCVDTRVRITANTGPQISTATWPEVSKWRRMSLWSHWFEPGERRFRSVDPLRKDSWRADAITWDEHKPEAFAGFHNAGRRIIYLFDESAAIAKPIFDESQGILSGAENTEIIWLCLGNPTRTDTEFRTFFPGGKNTGLWKSFQIDTRTARMSDKKQIQEWIDSYGIESDFVRVRVLSQFPRVSSTQFIPADLVEAAASPARDVSGTIYDPLIVGVDVARFGDDQTVVWFRRGLDARSIPPLKFRGLDNVQVAARLGEVNEVHRPDAIFIDDGGIGAGVVDICRQRAMPVTAVSFAGSPDKLNLNRSGAVRYGNKRMEMWQTMKDWLTYGAIADDVELKAELPAVQYGYVALHGNECIILEKKEDMKKRGLSSPDCGDALALTFAYPIGQSDHSDKLRPKRKDESPEYSPFAEMFKVRR
jgi:hypothetical protein